MKKLALLACVALLASACGGTSSGGSDQPAKTHATKAKVKPKPKFDNKAYAKKLEAAYVDAGQSKIKDQCDAAFTRWQCYYDGIRVNGQSFIYIDLSTPGDVSGDAAKAMSKQARLAWFNFVGDDFKKLDTIVTYVNGRDTGTTYRRDVPLLNR